VNEHRFHGTAAALSPGQFIKPGRQVGVANFEYDDPREYDQGLGLSAHGNPNDYVHAANEDTAWSYAGYTNRRYVYELDPAGDPGESDPNDDATRWKHPVKIARSIDIPPPSVFSLPENISHVQGTLPPTDWNKFTTNKFRDANAVPVYHERGAPKTSLEFAKERRAKMEANLDRLRSFRQIPGQGKLF